MTHRAVPPIVALAFLAGCSGDTTAPRPSDATVAHLINRQADAQGLARIGDELWFVLASHASAPSIDAPSTVLVFQRQDWSTGTLLESVRVRIPDTDFIVGGRNQDWSLNTTLAGHGDISLTFHTTGSWQKARFPVVTFPDGTIFRVTGNSITQTNEGGFDGTIFGESVSTTWHTENLLLTDNPVVERTP